MDLLEDLVHLGAMVVSDTLDFLAEAIKTGVDMMGVYEPWITALIVDEGSTEDFLGRNC